MKRESVRSLLTNHKLLFPVIAERLKRALNLKNDAELGRELGMSTSNFSNRKTSNSVPFEIIIPFCLMKSISTDWLFSGNGETFTNGEQSASKPVVPVEPLLFAEILTVLEMALRKDANGSKQRSMEVAKLGLIASDIYNKVMLISSQKARNQTIKEEAEQIAAVALILERQDEIIKKMSDE